MWILCFIVYEMLLSVLNFDDFLRGLLLREWVGHQMTQKEKKRNCLCGDKRGESLSWKIIDGIIFRAITSQMSKEPTFN